MTDNKPTDDELNRFLHEKVMGLCWHEIRELSNLEREPIYGWFGSVVGFKRSSLSDTCLKCGEPVGGYFHTNGETGEVMTPVAHQTAPNYCQSLDAVRAVELVVIEKVGWAEYGSTMATVTTDVTQVPFMLTARQRAESCKLAWEAMKEKV